MTPQFWASQWAASRAASVLRRTQEESPQRWREFYDAVAGLWDAMSGTRGGAYRAVAEILTGPGGPVRGKGTALEVGSGPGSLSLELARRGLRVTALDDSEGMQGELARRARRNGIQGIRQQRCPWTEFRPRRRFDLVTAASFPAAWSPEGLERLESLSGGHCCLTVGVGGDPFPFRRMLWERIMEDPLPSRSPALPFLFNWLLHSGRRPNLIHVTIPARLDVRLEGAVRFYAAYFAIFGHGGAAVERKIASTLGAHAPDGRLRARGASVTAVLWWRAPLS